MSKTLLGQGTPEVTKSLELQVEFWVDKTPVGTQNPFGPRKCKRNALRQSSGALSLVFLLFLTNKLPRESKKQKANVKVSGVKYTEELVFLKSLEVLSGLNIPSGAARRFLRFPPLFFCAICSLSFIPSIKSTEKVNSLFKPDPRNHMSPSNINQTRPIRGTTTMTGIISVQIDPDNNTKTIWISN